MNKCLVLVEDVGHDRDDAPDFLPAVGHIAQEYRDIVVRIGASIAARPRAEQHDALDPVAVDLIERRAKAFEDRIISG